MITLDQIRSDIAALQAKVATFEAQPDPLTFPRTIRGPGLTAGECYVGIIASADGTRAHHIILLPDTPAGELNWNDANTWAKSVGGELPDRIEGALLFATQRDQFVREAYWTREQHASDASYAWYQCFSSGDQGYYRVYCQLRARAVRRLPI